MADPISITAGVFGVIDHAARVSSYISDAFSSLKDISLEPIRLEIEMYSTILKEAGQMALSGTSNLPQSATLSLKLCEFYLSKLDKGMGAAIDLEKNSAIRKLKESKITSDLNRDLKEYRRSVKILRDVVMDAATQELLQRNSNVQVSQEHNGIVINNIIDTTQGTEMIEQQIETFLQKLVATLSSGGASINGLTINNRFTDRAAQDDGLSEDVLANLRKAAQGISTSSRPASNPFEFYADILTTHGQPGQGLKVCAKFDTGSEDNWISASIIARAGLQDAVEAFSSDKFYAGADGSLFQPSGKMSISWTRNTAKSWRTDFLVLENAPFDMLLGRKFIIDEGLFVFAEPVLVSDLTRLAPLSKEDYHQMEQNLRERGAQNEELSNTREAKDAAERQRRRAEKAASRMSLAASRASLAATPGSVTPSSFDQPSRLQQQTSNTDTEASSETQSRT